MSDASTKSARHALATWLPVVFWALVISGASSDEFRSSRTFIWIDATFRFFDPDVAFETVATTNFIVRKLAHLTEYAIFAAILVRAFRSEIGSKPRFPLLTAVVVAAAWSLLDEGRQSLSLLRTGSLADCMIDTCGGVLGALWMRRVPPAEPEVSAPPLPEIALRRSPPCSPSRQP